MDKVTVEQGRASMCGFIEPRTIQASENTLDHVKSYLQTWMVESSREIYIASYIDGHVLLLVIFYELLLIIQLRTCD